MSAALVDQFSGDFTPAEFEDEYQVELRTLIDEKLKQGDSLDTDATFGDQEAAREEAGSGSGDVIDLMEALKRSVEGKRSGTHRAPASKSTSSKSSKAQKTAKSPTGKKADGKETTTKNSGPQKTTGKKEGSKKPGKAGTATGKASAKKDKRISTTSSTKTAAKKGA